ETAESACREIRHHAEGRLESLYAAEGGGDPDRSGGIRRRVPDAHAEAGGDRGAAAAAAGRQSPVPRIARDTVEGAVGHPLPGEFRRRRLAEEDAAGLAQPRHAGALEGGALRRID